MQMYWFQDHDNKAQLLIFHLDNYNVSNKIKTLSESSSDIKLDIWYITIYLRYMNE